MLRIRDSCFRKGTASSPINSRRLSTDSDLPSRYESQEALEKHWSDPEYAKTMTMMQEEDLLAQAPNIIQGKLVEGFWSR